MPSVEAFTDGACRGNPGPGGWGVVLRAGAHVKELSGGEPATTNNRMELKAAIEALSALNKPCKVDLYTDSVYVRSGIMEWLPAWRARGWQTAEGKPVANREQWEALLEAARPHQVTWLLTRGEAAPPDLQSAAQLAAEAASGEEL